MRTILFEQNGQGVWCGTIMDDLFMEVGIRLFESHLNARIYREARLDETKRLYVHTKYGVRFFRDLISICGSETLCSTVVTGLCEPSSLPVFFWGRPEFYCKESCPAANNVMEECIPQRSEQTVQGYSGQEEAFPKSFESRMIADSDASPTLFPNHPSCFRHMNCDALGRNFRNLRNVSLPVSSFPNFNPFDVLPGMYTPDSFGYCEECRSSVGFLTRHHCRTCGALICNKCCVPTILPLCGLKDIKICKKCNSIINPSSNEYLYHEMRQ